MVKTNTAAHFEQQCSTQVSTNCLQNNWVFGAGQPGQDPARQFLVAGAAMCYGKLDRPVGMGSCLPQIAGQALGFGQASVQPTLFSA